MLACCLLVVDRTTNDGLFFWATGPAFLLLTAGLPRFFRTYQNLAHIGRGFDPTRAQRSLRAVAIMKLFTDGIMVGLLALGHLMLLAVWMSQGNGGDAVIYVFLGSLGGVGLYGIGWIITVAIESLFLRGLGSVTLPSDRDSRL